MERLEILAEKREITGKHVKELRREGIVPAIIFGHAIDPTPIQIPEKQLRTLLIGGGLSRLVSLKVGKDRPFLALTRDIQRNALTAAVQHIDFQAVVMTEKIRAQVSLVFVGQSAAVAEGIGQTHHLLDTLDVECLPADLVQSIEVDITPLAHVDDMIHVKELNIPASIRVLTSGDDAVIRITHIAMAEEEAAPAETTTGEVEVIKKRKAEEE